MSIHRSLVVKSQLARSRNVWTRIERLNKLEEQGKLPDGRSVFGLPKVRTTFKAKAARVKKKKDEKDS